MHPDLQGRRAKFRIADSYLQGSPDAVMALLSRVLIVEARYDYAYNAIEYHGYSRIFNVVPAGEETPRLGISKHETEHRSTGRCQLVVDEMWFSPYGEAVTRRDIVDHGNDGTLGGIWPRAQ